MLDCVVMIQLMHEMLDCVVMIQLMHEMLDCVVMIQLMHEMLGHDITCIYVAIKLVITFVIALDYINLLL